MDAVTVANPDPTSPDSNTEISLQELPPSDGVLDSTESTQSSTAQSKPVFYFGCGPWHPKWLQVLANAKFYTFILCFFVIVEGSITSGFVSTVLSTVERRYNFSSTAAGFITCIYEITYTLAVIFVWCFGGRGHTAKWLGMGCFIQGIGCLIFMSPQFIFFNNTPPEAADNQFQLCSTNVTEVTCNSSNTVAYLLLLLGQIVIGIGASTVYSIGITYLDELVHPKYISFHLAIIYVVQLIGPTIGFGLGGALLSIYVDPWVSTDLIKSDTNFIGAWWLFFLVTGILSLLISIPFFMYPRTLNSKVIDEVAKAGMEKIGEVIPPKGAPSKDIIKILFILKPLSKV